MSICPSPRRKTLSSYEYTPVDRARIAQNRTRLSVGSPATVKARLMPLIEATKADELMVTSMLFDHARTEAFIRAVGQGVCLILPVVTGLVPVTPLRMALNPPKRDGRDIGVRKHAVLPTAIPGHDEAIHGMLKARPSFSFK